MAAKRGSSVDESDLGTPELRQHEIVSEEKTVKGKRRSRVETETPINYYKLRGWLTEKQERAGKEFYRIWYYGAEKLSYVQMRYCAEPEGGAPDYESKMIMEQKYKAALKAMRYNERQITHNVCCLGEWAKSVEVPGVMKRENKMTLLREALDGLAIHFGY